MKQIMLHVEPFSPSPQSNLAHSLVFPPVMISPFNLEWTGFNFRDWLAWAMGSPPCS